MTTIFDKIIAGEIPCHKVYEDDLVLAFLDIAPVAYGHTLVIPKEAKATLGELSDESAAAVGKALPRICRAVCKATGCDDYNILQNNGERAHQAVFHVHFHVIPKPAVPYQQDCAPQKSGLGIDWPTGTLDDGAALAEKIMLSLDK